MSEIHYFPRYSQPENVVTNNTLLLLLRLHHYNRFKFEKFMERLCAEEDIQLAGSWLSFSQQKGTGKSVVDGFISQESLKIAVETKLTDGFDPTQLENHLDIFGPEQHKLLILLSPSIGSALRSQLESIRAGARDRNVQVVHTSFENIVDTARSCLSEYDEEMRALVEDFEAFCSDMSLLPRDKYTMFVPPCSKSFQDNKQFALYYCPTSYSRRNVTYLGIYANKTVRAVGQIEKVVTCNVSTSDSKVTVVEGPDLTSDEDKRILRATENARARSWDLSTGHRFYLCEELVETDFRKHSKGGIWGQRYFDLETVLRGKIPKDVAELATLLRRHTWE